MTIKTQTIWIDDLTGAAGEDVSTRRFMIDGSEYEIDLDAANTQKLRLTFASYIEKARKANGRGSVRRGPRTQARVNGTANGTSSTVNATANVAAPTVGISFKSAEEVPSGSRNERIRQWGRANGHVIKDRGRIPANIVAEYDATH